MIPFLPSAQAAVAGAAGAVWARRGLIGIGALALLCTFGLGYAKGRTSKPSYPPTPFAPVILKSTKDIERQADSTGKSQRDSKTDLDEDIVETRTLGPAQTLPDGSTVQKTRIARKTAKAEKEVASLASQEHVVEKIVTKEVVVPCPAPEVLACPSSVQLPRFMAGPQVARDLDVGKTVYGGTAAVRTGPVFWRLIADSHPQVGAAVEVFW